MRTFGPSFPAQMTQETGKRPNGAAAAILVISSPHIDARAYLRGGHLWRFCRGRNFVRHCARVIVDSPLKTELSGVYKGVNFGASRGKAVLIYSNWSIDFNVSVLYFKSNDQKPYSRTPI
jgi:hypothetical protein